MNIPGKSKRKQAVGAVDDADLVRRMLAGDERAFETFADDYVPAVYRFAARRLDGDRELTKEIAQNTICKAIAKLATFRGDAALTTWLCAICRNEIAGYFRSQNRPSRKAVRQVEVDPDTLPDTGGPQFGLLQREKANLVHEALDTVPPHYGQALEWKYLENLPVVEIADRLGVGPKAAESLLTRARKAFRARYEELVGSAPPLTSGTARSVARSL